MKPPTATALSRPTTPDQAVGCYIHVPFCQKKCAYCTFFSLAGATVQTRRDYFKHLRRELQQKTAELKHPLHTLYVGGGSPSLLSPTELDELLQTLRQTVPLADAAEFSVECNPDQLNTEKLSLFHAAGVTRVSLGIQSFLPRLRQTIGRTGSLDKLSRHIEHLHNLGIAVNLDLIYGIPGQTLQDWQQDLETATDLFPDHLSAYQLTLSPDAPLHRQGMREINTDTAAQQWEFTGQYLAKSGLRRYEVSNYACPGQECRHNLDIWHGRRFIAAGPAAAWFRNLTRYRNPENLDHWLHNATPETDYLPPAERALEILATGLRCVDGWDLDDFQFITGFELKNLRTPQLFSLLKEGLLQRTAIHLRPTQRGLLLADFIARELL